MRLVPLIFDQHQDHNQECTQQLDKPCMRNKYKFSFFVAFATVFLAWLKWRTIITILFANTPCVCNQIKMEKNCHIFWAHVLHAFVTIFLPWLNCYNLFRVCNHVSHVAKLENNCHNFLCPCLDFATMYLKRLNYKRTIITMFCAHAFRLQRNISPMLHTIGNIQLSQPRQFFLCIRPVFVTIFHVWLH